MKGSKTYIICALAVVYAVSGFFTGHLDANVAIETVLAALAAAGLRHVITNSQ